MFIVESTNIPFSLSEFIRLSALHIYRVTKSVNKRNIGGIKKKQYTCIVLRVKVRKIYNRPVLYTLLVRISTCSRWKKRKRLYHFRARYRKV